MDRTELIEKLIRSHEGVCDIERPFQIGEDTYDGYAFFDVTGAKYVLVKQAELWRQNTKEHIFFLSKEQVTAEDVHSFYHHVVEMIEPKMVLNGQKTMPKDHMLTYITAMFVSDKAIDPETEKAVRKMKFFKNYSFGIRGYSEARLVVFDIAGRRLIGNKAAKSVIKTYKKVFH